jgi:hypothetical protein
MKSCDRLVNKSLPSVPTVWRQVKDHPDSEDLAVPFRAEMWDIDYEKGIKYNYENVKVFYSNSIIIINFLYRSLSIVGLKMSSLPTIALEFSNNIFMLF